MGDHRASIKIEFSMHGVEDSCDMWINYSPDPDCFGYDIDRRVCEFFHENYHKAMNKFNEAQYEASREKREAEQKTRDAALEKLSDEDKKTLGL